MSFQNYVIEFEDRECIMCFYNVNNTNLSEQPYIFSQQCNCYYVIHYDCLYEWIKQNNRCILCHEPFIISYNNNLKSSMWLKIKKKLKLGCCK